MENYKRLLNKIKEEEQELIGISNYETGMPDKMRLQEFVLSIDINACKGGLIDTSEFELLGKSINEDTYYKYIVPANYAKKLQKEGYNKYYNQKMKPLLYEFKFNYNGSDCILYYVGHQEEYSEIFLNVNAMNAIKDMPLDEIKNIVMEMNKTNITEKLRTRK